MIKRPIIGRVYEPTTGSPEMRHPRLVTRIQNYNTVSSPLTITFQYIDQDIDNLVQWREWESWIDIMKPTETRIPLLFEWDINGSVSHRRSGKVWEDGGPDGFHIIVVADAIEDAEARVKDAYQKQYGEPPLFPFNDPTVRRTTEAIIIQYSTDGG